MTALAVSFFLPALLTVRPDARVAVRPGDLSLVIVRDELLLRLDSNGLFFWGGGYQRCSAWKFRRLNGNVRSALEAKCSGIWRGPMDGASIRSHSVSSYWSAATGECCLSSDLNMGSSEGENAHVTRKQHQLFSAVKGRGGSCLLH
jgi:hypothetical protein